MSQCVSCVILLAFWTVRVDVDVRRELRQKKKTVTGLCVTGSNSRVVLKYEPVGINNLQIRSSC